MVVRMKPRTAPPLARACSLQLAGTVPGGLLAAELGVVLLARRVLGQARRVTRQGLCPDELVTEVQHTCQWLHRNDRGEQSRGPKAAYYLAVEGRGRRAPGRRLDGEQSIEERQRRGREVLERFDDFFWEGCELTSIS
jgi:hypothetical protein